MTKEIEMVDYSVRNSVLIIQSGDELDKILSTLEFGMISAARTKIGTGNFK